MNIAVTGCFGSGKSTVSKMLARHLDADYLDTDRLCRQMLEPEAAGYVELVKLYGRRFLASDGAIDRVALRRAVFSSPEVKSALEAILHPLVQHKVAEGARGCRLGGRHQVVEVPLLFEVGWQGAFDSTVVVSGEERQRLARVQRRDGLASEEIEAIAATQMSSVEKERLGTYVINNTGTFAATALQIAWLVKRLVLLEKEKGESPERG